MKIYISADIEGTSGISCWDEAEKGKNGYDYFAARMTEEVEAVCSGVNSACPGCGIYVKDAHDSGGNIDHQKLPGNVSLNRNWSGSPLSMMDGIDHSFDAAIFTGFHSAAGTNGSPLAHTMNLGIASILINGIVASECLICYYTALYYGVPLVMLAGDEALCESMKMIEPNLRTVASMAGAGGSVTSEHPDIIKGKLFAAAKEAVAGIAAMKAKIKLPDAFRTEINFKSHGKALRAAYYPGAKQAGAHTVTFDTDDFYEFLRYYMFVE